MKELFSILIWCLPISFCLHVCEEFILPGGFIKWYNNYRPKFAYRKPISYYIENLVFIALTFNVAYHTTTQHNLVVFLIVCGFLSFNAVITHIRGAIITRQYSPGMITGIVFQIPVAIMSYSIVLKSGYLNISSVMICLLVSPLLEAIFAFRPVKKINA